MQKLPVVSLTFIFTVMYIFILNSNSKHLFMPKYYYQIFSKLFITITIITIMLFRTNVICLDL